jgi:MutS-like protein
LGWLCSFFTAMSRTLRYGTGGKAKTLETDMPLPPTDTDSIVALYRRRVADFDRWKELAARRANRISHGRVATFLAAAACFLAGGTGAPGTLAWFAGGVILAAAFLWLVRLHRRTLAESMRCQQLGLINGQGVARVLRRWKRIPLVDTPTPTDEEALAADLDLSGNASLFHLICLANTPKGIGTLRDWLLHPAEPDVIAERQEAVAEFAPLLENRQELHRRGLKLAAGRMDPGRFLRWAEGDQWLANRPWLTWASRCLPALILVSIVLGATGMLPASTWIFPFCANVVLGFAFCGQVHAIFASISSRHGEIREFAGLFELIGETPCTSDELARLQQQTAEGGVAACRRIDLLGRIMDLANLRFSSMAYFLVQSLTSWDFHVLALLERWQRRDGRHVRRWFEALGEWEALASLASLAHDNPSWVYPTIEEQADTEKRIIARSLGHPLIPQDVRVANDVTVGPPKKFLMVTGSNMSGKSTLLRAIGTNVALAQAGSPVCAEQFNLPPVLLATSMRIHDSLSEGVSYYMAELRRLKQIVDAARARQTDSGRVLFYLLDEILQGTNTAERQIAVRQVLAHLLGEGAIGAISTHDLELATVPSLNEACHAVHFRETIHNELGRHDMTFDYKLRPGVATTTNALKLLEIVGLAGKTEQDGG